MSIIHVNQIGANLRDRFASMIDMSDVTQTDPEQREAKFLSRALAAFAVATLAKTSDTIAAASVVDEYNDDGIDAFYLSSTEHIAYLVQSKWSKDGSGTIDLAAALKFIHGVNHFIEGRLDCLGSRMNARKKDIESAIHDSQMKFVLVAAYSGKQSLAPDVRKPFDELIDNLNDGEELVSLETLRQQDLIDVVRQRALGESIKFNVLLREWGKVSEPYKSFYGQLEISDIVPWAKYGEFLYNRNIRGFKGSTDVNDAIVASAKERPDDFLYLNNGITLLCERVVKQPLGGMSRTSGVFECEGVSVVNGAQTVGSVIAALSHPNTSSSSARVMVRLISLENCPPDFGADLTRATNTQNRIEKRDFAALDKEQARLKSDLLLSLGKEYVFRTGDHAPDPRKGCTLDEATIALACANPDISYCMTAKRELGKLYEDVEASPYKSLFNPQLTAERLWRSVDILRRVEVCLLAAQGLSEGKERLIAIHGNRLVLYLVFRKMGSLAFDESVADESLSAAIFEQTFAVLARMNEMIAAEFAGAYPASLFKNISKCKAIALAIA